MIEPLKETALREVGLVGVAELNALSFTTINAELPQKDVPTAGNSNEHTCQFIHMVFRNCSSIIIIKLITLNKHNTVKPPKRGHFGTGLFVPSSEVVPFWEVGPYLVFYHTI